MALRTLYSPTSVCLIYPIPDCSNYSNGTDVHTEGDPSSEFNTDWVHAWCATENHRLFAKFTDSHLFDIVDPKHPCSGGLTIDDISRRLAQQVSDLHLDDRLATSRDFASKHLAAGQKKVSSALTTVWADIEELRETQRRKAEEARREAAEARERGEPPGRGLSRPDLEQVQKGVQAGASKAGAYLAGWGAWAAEKRRVGWGRGTPVVSPVVSPGVGGRAEFPREKERGREKEKENENDKGGEAPVGLVAVEKPVVKTEPEGVNDAPVPAVVRETASAKTETGAGAAA